MSRFTPTPEVDTPEKQLNRDLARADKEARRQLTTWMQMLEVFWQAPVTHGENAASKADIQAKIDSDPAAAQILLSASKDFITYHMGQDAELVTEMVDPRFLLDGAYTWVDGTLTLDTLRPEWDIPAEEAPVVVENGGIMGGEGE